MIVDRISDLPDSILGHILSFLPTTEEAVATSVLSKRWKFAWVTIHDLYFSNLNRGTTYEEIMEFVGFVNRVLLLNDAGWLNKFTLAFHHGSSPNILSYAQIMSVTHIISWIDTAITRNVHHLNVTLGGSYMPKSIFSCESLRSLVLHDFTCIDDATAVCLPRLESLTMHRVSFESEEACKKLISGSPMLHYLNLVINDYGDDTDDDDDDDDFTCIISSASLRHLEIGFDHKIGLKLNASSLEYLTLRCYISEIFVEKNLSSLVEARFDIKLDEDDFPNNSIVEAVRAFDCAEFVYLSGDVMRALSRATISLSTEFKRLVKLDVEGYWCPLQDFIQSSDNLEFLHIAQEYLQDHSRWNALVEVPRCLSNSLKTVRLEGYTGREDEREMIRYMLKHGSVLEVMQISCSKMEDREN